MLSKTSALRIVVGVAVIGTGLAAISIVQSRQQLAEQNEQLRAEAALKDMPVTVEFRKGLLAHGKVAVLRNTGGVGIAVRAEIVDAASHQKRAYKLDLDPGRPTDFGQFQGYTFEPGDTLSLSHDGYKTVRWETP